MEPETLDPNETLKRPITPESLADCRESLKVQSQKDYTHRIKKGLIPDDAVCAILLRSLMPGDTLPGYFTRQHASSSYGQPVFVAEGVAYGTGDLPEGATIRLQWPGQRQDEASERKTMLEMRTAVFNMGYPITPIQHSGQCGHCDNVIRWTVGEAAPEHCGNCGGLFSRQN